MGKLPTLLETPYMGTFTLPADGRGEETQEVHS